MPPRLPRASIRSLFGRNVSVTSCRTLIAPPRATDGPLMERRSDRALPEITSRWSWMRTIPLFAAIVVGSSLAIFNYQKSSSSVVNSTLYALRTNPEARELLGDQVYFGQKYPWIWGEINQVHGRIDIEFKVKGTRGSGMMKFRSYRRTRMGFFQTEEWSLTTEDGTRHDLLQSDKPDPFKGMEEGERGIATQLAS